MAKAKGKDNNTEQVNKGGRPEKYTPEQLEDLIDSFTAKCDAEKLIPDDYELLRYLRISPRTLDNYYTSVNDDSKSDKKDKYCGYCAAVKKLIAYREHYNSMQARDNPKTIGFIAFRQKQSRWGGWTDRQETKTDLNIRVRLNGDDV